MLRFFFDLSYELSVALDPSEMLFAFAGGAGGQGTYHTSKKAAVFGARGVAMSDQSRSASAKLGVRVAS